MMNANSIVIADSKHKELIIPRDSMGRIVKQKNGIYINVGKSPSKQQFLCSGRKLQTSETLLGSTPSSFKVKCPCNDIIMWEWAHLSLSGLMQTEHEQNHITFIGEGNLMSYFFLI